MKIGVPKEIKVHEYRVGLIPAAVGELCARGHSVFVETGAGAGVGYRDEDYHHCGASILPSPAEVFQAADLIVSVTPGVASLESAEAFAPVLTGRHTFLDFASATPKVKQGVAERLSATGALLGDAAIEGTPLHGYSMRMLSSGPAGERVRDLLVPWGMQIEFTGPVLGTASGIKIIRSVLIKGIEALTDEMLLAAHQYGIDEIVLASASKTLARPWMDTVKSLPPSGVIHAKRRAEELEMSAEAVADSGVEPIMARAIAQRLRWKASLELKDHFKGIVPSTYQEALDRAREAGDGRLEGEVLLSMAETLERLGDPAGAALQRAAAQPLLGWCAPGGPQPAA